MDNPTRIRQPADPGPRPVAIHAHPCRRCPSAHFSPDPEAEQIAGLVQSGKLTPAEAVFPCAWRPTRICRGAADTYGYTDPTLEPT